MKTTDGETVLIRPLREGRDCAGASGAAGAGFAETGGWFSFQNWPELLAAPAGWPRAISTESPPNAKLPTPIKADRILFIMCSPEAPPVYPGRRLFFFDAGLDWLFESRTSRTPS